MKKWKIVGSVVLAAAVAGAGFTFYPRSNKTVAAIPAGQIVEVQTGTVQLTVNASGAVSLPRQAKLNFGSSGKVAQVKVRTGDRVQKDQVLAKLDTVDLERSVARTEADLKLAMEKQKIQYTSADTAKAQAATDVARSNLAKAEADLKVSSIERSSAQATVASARANLVKAQADLDVSILERASAQAAVDSAKANLAKAEADLNSSSVERSAAEVALEQAKLTLDNAKTEASLDLWDAQNTLQKASDRFQELARSKVTEVVLDEAWQAQQRAQLQYQVEQQATVHAIKEAENNFAKAQDSLARLLPGGATILQREAAVAAAKAALAKAQDDLTKLLPGGATIQQREAAVGVAKAALVSAEDDVTRLLPGGYTILQREASVAAARATLDKAQEELVNMKSGVSSLLDSLSQELSIDKLKSTVADTKDSLAKATILAPYDGTVNDVNVKEGDTVSGTTVAIVVVDTNVKEVQATVDEVDVAQLRLGQDANVTFDALSGLTARARVVALAPDAKVQSGVVNYAVTVALLLPDSNDTSPQARTQQQTPRSGGAAPGGAGASPQTKTQQPTPKSGGAAPGGAGASSQTKTQQPTPKSGGAAFGGQGTMQGTMPGARLSPRAQAGGTYDSLKGGMTALAEIIVQRKDDVLLVPNKAIKTSGRDRTVQVVLPSGFTETRKVTTGITDGQNTEIVDGLGLGEKVLIPAATPSAPRTSQQQQQISKVPGIPKIGF